MFGKNKNIGIVCNDAGSANIIIYWVKKFRYNYIIKVTGPAKKIFFEIQPKLKYERKLKTLVEKSDIIISGTSAKSTIDHRARYLSKKYKKKVIGLLDHWTLYKEGFTHNNKILLPDEIWVTDNKAKKIADKQFKSIKIKKKQNLLQIYASKIPRKKIKKIINILYILEPINNNIEFDILKEFLIFLKKNDLYKKINIIFKAHPSEKIIKYKKFINMNCNHDFKIVKDSKILEYLRWSHLVFGLRSFALVLAIKAKRKVFTCLPKRNIKFTLPYKNIILFDKNIKKKIIKIINV